MASVDAVTTQLAAGAQLTADDGGPASAKLLSAARQLHKLASSKAGSSSSGVGAAEAHATLGQAAAANQADTDDADASYADLRPRLAALLGVFGADRLMWGSDFPYVVLEAGGYSGSKAALEAMLGDLGVGEADAAMVLGGTAQKLFFVR